MNQKPQRWKSEYFLSREAIILGAVFAAVVGGVVLIIILTRGFDYVLRSDAQHYYRVALDPFGNGKSFQGAPAGSGTAYRYGRILYPFVAWVLAMGRAAWIRWTLPMTYVFGAGLMVAASAEVCRSGRRSQARGMLVLLLPAVWITIPLLVPEFFEVGLLLLTFLLVQRGKESKAALVASALLLTRETLVLAIIPIFARRLWERRFRDACMWALTGVPLLIWWTWVRFRIGLWPFRDVAAIDYRPPLALPWHGFISAPLRGFHGGILQFAVACGIVTVVLATWAQFRRTWFPITQGALALALLILFLGGGPVSLPGDGFRLMTSAEVLTLLAFIARSTVGDEHNQNGEQLRS